MPIYTFIYLHGIKKNVDQSENIIEQHKIAVMCVIQQCAVGINAVNLLWFYGHNYPLPKTKVTTRPESELCLSHY